MTTGIAEEPNPDGKLADAFEAVERAAWLELVNKALKGSGFERRLVAKTDDGIAVQPIYTRRDTIADAEKSVPGVAPYTRGTHGGVAGLGWQIRQIVVDADPQTANRHVLEELEAGSNGIVLQIEAPGQPGVRIAGVADVTTTLAGARLDLAPVQLKAGLYEAQAARHSVAALNTLGADPRKALLHLNLDPIGTLARWGRLSGPADDVLRECIEIARTARAAIPNVKTFGADASIYHDAGAGEVQELATLAATLVTYLRAFEQSGVAPVEALTHIAVTLAADDDIFLTLAKLRAARQVIWQIAQACGAGTAAANVPLTAVTSQRMLAKRDPWTNILRATAACAAAAFGGADAITVHPFTWPLGQPDVFARRVARNIQIVCQEESSLGKVVDPAGGSWYVERLTRDLAHQAWTLFQDIEGRGGIISTLRDGWLQAQIGRITTARQDAIAAGRKALTGVSAFPILGDDGVKFMPWPAAPALDGAAEVAPFLPRRLAEPFEELRDRADASEAASGHPLRVFLANIGRVIDHTQRSTWVKNFLAAGGIDALTNDGFSDAQAAAKAFVSSGAQAACICSTDTLYADHGLATAKALKAAGAKLVLMAGKPKQGEGDLRAAGVDQFLFAGCNAIATLEGLQETLAAA